MKKFTSVIITFLLLTTLIAHAEDLTGTLSAEKNEKGKITALSFKSDAGKSYNVKNSGAAGKIIKEGEGKTVTVKGKVSSSKNKEGADEEWLSISSYEFSLKGKVEVTKDKKNITAVKVGGTELKLDGKAKQIGQKAENKEITATGKYIKVTAKDKSVSELFQVKDYTLSTEEKK